MSGPSEEIQSGPSNGAPGPPMSSGFRGGRTSCREHRLGKCLGEASEIAAAD